MLLTINLDGKKSEFRGKSEHSHACSIGSDGRSSIHPVKLPTILLRRPYLILTCMDQQSHPHALRHVSVNVLDSCSHGSVPCLATKCL